MMYSQPMHVCIYVYMSAGGLQDSKYTVSYWYMDTVFEPVVHEESEIQTSLPHNFMKRGLL